MKTKTTPPSPFLGHVAAIGRALSALTLAAFALTGGRAFAGWSSQGQINQPVYNDFEDGQVPFGDGFPSSTGGTLGWNNAWTVGFSAGAVITTNVSSSN